jgi:protein phosphatase
MFQVWHDEKTDKGRKRKNNQDYVGSFEPVDEADLRVSGRLYVVADGVGGASKGDKASRYAVEKVLFEYYRMTDIPPEERLRRLIRQAGNEINNFAEDSPTFMRMATTIVAAVVLDNQLILAHVGDSRAYMIRDGITTQLTEDHSWVSEMVRSGVMTEEEARSSKKKNRITRSLGGERNVKVDINRYQLQVGDKILLCSDGFSQYASQDQISRLVADGDAEEITERMIGFANRSGGSDNISVSLLEIHPSTYEAPTIRRELAAPDPLSDMPTDPGISGHRQSRRERKPFYLDRWFILGGAAVVVVIALFSLTLMFVKILSGGGSSTQQAGGGLDSGYTPILSTLTPEPTISNTIASSTKTIVGPTATSKSPDNATFTPTPTFTPTLDPKELEKRPGDLITCRYEIKEKDREFHPGKPLTMVDLLDLTYTRLDNKEIGDPIDFEPYALNIRCADIVENANCTYEPGTYNAEVGWLLDFPGIKRGVCKAVEGVVIE